jgi:hypothetical protein
MITPRRGQTIKGIRAIQTLREVREVREVATPTIRKPGSRGYEVPPGRVTALNGQSLDDSPWHRTAGDAETALKP